MKRLKKEQFIGFVALIIIGLGAYAVRTQYWYIPYSRFDSEGIQYSLNASQKQHFGFEEANKALDINFTYRTPKFDQAFAHRVDTYFVGSGIGVSDVNDDGYMDIFIPAGRAGDKNHLYISLQGERFVERANEWGVDANPPQTAPTHPAFFDYDNNGTMDLFLVGAGCSRLFKNTGERFEAIENSGLTDCRNSKAGIALDYDRDGDLDVYVLRYWPEVNLFDLPRYDIYVNNLTGANNGGNNTLYRNNGDGTFTDVSDEMGAATTQWSFDATWGDLRANGGMAMYIANDYGPDSFYEITPEGWHDISREVMRPDRRYGMNTTMVDKGTQNPMVYISNGFLGAPYDITGNFAWEFTDDKVKGTEISREKNLFDCGFAWGGLAADFNRDGYQDMFVSNGFVSNGPPPGKDPKKRTARGRDGFGEFDELSARSLPGAVSADIREWPDHSNINAFGWQRDCLFINLGNSGFDNQARNLGIDNALRDSRSPAAIDLKNDGRISFIVKPNKGPVTFYRNTIAKGDNWVGFAMQGTTSNRMGAGARIEVTQGEHTQYRWNTAGHTGFMATSDPRMHFGLKDTSPVNVTIYWPSGIKQTMHDIKPAKYYDVVEPHEQ